MYSEYFKLFESKKRLEYIVERQALNRNLLNSPDFKDMSKWRLSFSEQSKLEDGNVLVCESNNGLPCWAILSQKLRPEVIANQNVTLSVKFEAYKDSLLNFCIRAKDNTGKYRYFLHNQFNSDNEITVSYVTGVLPEESELKDAEFLVYLNKPAEKAKVVEVKLELGNLSTLY